MTRPIPAVVHKAARLLCVLMLASSCNGSDPAKGTGEPDPVDLPPGEVPMWSYRVVNAFPHDTSAYTQGLVYADGVFLEGTGGGTRLRSRNLLSSLRRVSIETGEVQQQVTLDEQFFGEGITLLHGRVYQLTWRSRVGFLYDLDGLKPLGSFNYAASDTTGWGLTHDGESLWMSDGSAVLTRRNPDDFRELGRIEVTHKDKPIRALNELEWVQGEIWANVYTTDIVARIDPTTGLIVGWIDLRGLLTSTERQSTDVLNGIAWDPLEERIFVTGKLWPWIFEIELVSG